MLVAASVALAAVDLGGLVWWLLVGLIAGALAGLVMRGGGYGIVGDIIVGLVGALVGGFIAGLLGLGSSGLIGSIIIAFIGACIFIAILRAVSSGTRRTL
ncbi:MAG: GlsB/YeaQ/YmgE family stress response membrane protein [Ktedonobacteraceae bacterium]|nr:GlsB/YeaQ/YmgE family stress response membrane protein [Ktedonobacteraceae bacterium]